MNTFQIEIATPERIVYTGQAESVSLPTIDGEITVLAHHMPIVSLLKSGELMIKNGNNEFPMAVSGGFVRVEPDKIVILADYAERIEEISEERAEEARQRAEDLRKRTTSDDVEFARLNAKLERDLNRLKIVRKYRHRGHSGITGQGILRDGDDDQGTP
jgi:F-type H+-transporting ATPase subunit epsilon